jgi:hypothetical protein
LFFVGSEKKEQTDGIMTYLEGNAQKTELKSHNWKFVKENDAVSGGEKVKTLDKSRAELELDIGKVIRMAPLTEVNILKLYKEITEKGKKSDMKLSIKQGAIYSKIDALGEDETLEIETPLASATIRGTIFQINCEKDDKVQLDVIKGKVWVYSNEVKDPKAFYEKNKSPHRIGKPFKRIKKPYKQVSKGEWLEIVKSMQRITITRDGKTEVTDLNKEDINTKWIEWNKKLDSKGLK